MGVTLWIVPAEHDVQRLQAIMHLRAEEPHSNSSYPKFTPHITLALVPKDLNFELPTLRAAVPPSQERLAIDFESVEVGSTYFRSVYIAVKLSPELTTLHQHVHASLGVDPKTPSFPHVSLCYIDDNEEDERRRFQKTLQSEGRIREEFPGSVAVNCGPNDEEDWMSGFEAAEIWVVNCEGPVEEWEILEKIPIS
ncbi:2',3'-cyclic-nucleotide 3'-phosphodiesterase [Crucibulum laeve]|uniref:2',3'-cyclic-nucleotide 3'-phosphodiesterase n=1 Tax=Crucibulum laeve TaxID=68775 RepID=A0A5C3MB59_9AGAR|nr:2',3'-cyclic-nucleotide 3'-phosphodiesterase [Crucibulum laeve]